MPVVVVKIGTSTLVDPDGAFREEILEARVADLVELRRRGYRPVLVTSGAIALGLARLGVTGRPTALPDLQAASAVGQGVLIKRYIRAFAEHDTVAAQVLLTSGDLADRATYINARNTLQRLLDLSTVPVVNENDTTATDDITFGDNDVLASQVAILLGARMLVLLTDRDGLYGPGPDGPVLIEDVPEGTDPEDVELASIAGSGLGRGGITSKITSASMATAAGVPTVIANGSADGIVLRVVEGGGVATRFPASGTSGSAFKLWLRYAKPTRGRVTVDGGAAAALAHRGTSLLAVGITDCDGDFQMGDAVEVAGPDGTLIGKGIANLPADQIRGIVGLSSAQVRTRVPGIPDEVIHRDRFVLVERNGAEGRR